ncbi:DUF5134 domain-containing protein [Streptomyces sp. C11-1]|uniref:DUF5134 domain-containing protein n=1 Tax=Streptomyces durocortorensis TaxID=2811104 RepID=A0ABY9VV73_9ACTN|nr:DUF5134 domain-containing protein [Streptomyces durocortorensis]WNF25652.1 DUF5134 domain-containing protein [Streptomyces durocortorensis]
MHGGTLVGWMLLALCAVSGAYCLLHARTGTPAERRAARAEALMGFGMAAMAVPAAVLPPPEWAWALYAVLFGAAALRSLRPALGGGHHLHHLIGSLAMVYMAITMAPAVSGGGGDGHAGHGAAGGAGGIPALTGALLVYYAFYVLSSAGRLLPVAAAPGGVVRVAGRGPGGFGSGTDERSGLTTACRLTMGIAMFAMLLTL